MSWEDYKRKHNISQNNISQDNTSSGSGWENYKRSYNISQNTFSNNSQPSSSGWEAYKQDYYRRKKEREEEEERKRQEEQRKKQEEQRIQQEQQLRQQQEQRQAQQQNQQQQAQQVAKNIITGNQDLTSANFTPNSIRQNQQLQKIGEGEKRKKQIEEYAKSQGIDLKANTPKIQTKQQYEKSIEEKKNQEKRQATQDIIDNTPELKGKSIEEKTKYIKEHDKEFSQKYREKMAEIDEKYRVKSPSEKFFNDVGNVVENTFAGIGKGFVNIGRQVSRDIGTDFGEDSPLYMLFGEATRPFGTDDNGYTKGYNAARKVGKNVEDVSQKAVDETTKRKQELQDFIDENIANQNSKTGKKIAELTPSIGQMLPSMAVSTINPVAGGLVAAETASDDYYDDAVSRGMNEQEANTYSHVMGAIEGITENIQLNKAVNVGKKIAGKGIAKETTTSALKDFGFDVADNFVQEAVTEPISEATAQFIGGEEVADWDNIGDRMLQSGFNGAISAVITNGVSAGIGSAVKVSNKLNNGEQVTQEEIKQAVQDIQKSGKVDVEQVIKDEIKSQTNKVTNENQQQKLNQIAQLDEQIANTEVNNTADFKEQQIVEETLNEIYNERAKLQQELQEQISKNQQSSYQYKISDNEKIDNLRQDASKYLDGSEKSFDLVSTIEKVVEDKDYIVRLDNTITNENGQTVNAQIKTLSNGETEIRINPDSDRVAEFLLTHEITHAIETDSMKNLVIDYASKNKDFAGALQELKEQYGVEDVSDEVLADVSGQLFGNQEFINELSTQKPTLFRKILNKIVSLANKITGNSNEALFIKDLKNKWQEAYSNTNKNIDGTKYHISKNFENEIDKALNNQLPSNTQVKARDYTPEILVKNGVEDLPMLITQKHIRSIVYTSQEVQNLNLPIENTNYHGLGKEQLVKAIDSLDNPDAIYQHTNGKYSNKNYVVITSIKDSNGNNIIVPIQINGKGNYNNLIIDENQIKTAYAKNNINDYIKNNNLKEIYKKEELDFNERVQFPDIANSSKSSIQRENEKVNINISEENQKRLSYFRSIDTSQMGLVSRGAIKTEIRALENGFNSVEEYREVEKIKQKKAKEEAEKERQERANKKAQQEKEKQEKLNKEISEATPFKKAQFNIIQESNPMQDDYHVGIRSPADIKSAEEAFFDDGESFAWGDFSYEDAQKALKDGKVIVYSSYPINQGVFVSTSKIQAEEYAGGNKVYSKIVPLDEVAWINGDEGQYAKVNNDTRYSKSSNIPLWQQFLEDNFKNRGTTTQFKDILQKSNKDIQQALQNEISNIVAPIQETMQKMSEQIDSLTKEQAPIQSGLTQNEEMEKLLYDNFIENKGYDKLDEQSKRRYEYLQSQDQNETQNVLEDNTEVTPLENRNINDVGNRSVKAYQYENPEVKPYFQQEAKNMLIDLQETIPADRYKVGDEWQGTTRSTTKAIAELKDDWGYSYKDIEKGLKAIIEDNGAENNAVSKRIEFKLDEQLREGYTDIHGYQVKQNQDYINFLQEKEIDSYNQKYNTLTDEEIEYDVLQQNAPYNEKIDNTVKIINDAINQAKYSLNAYEEIENYEPLSKNEKIQGKLENQGDTISNTINRITSKRTREKTPISKMKDDLVQTIVNKAHYVDKLAKETKNPQLKYAYDRMLGSFSEGQYCIGKEQVNSKGEVTGKGIMEIFKPAIKSKLYNEFNDYLFHKHNIDRQAVNKAVFGKEFTVENSKRIITEYNEKYPQFKEWSRNVYRFNKNNLKEMLDEGFISQSTYESLSSMYGHYVPTFRDIADSLTDEDNSVTFDFTGTDKNKEKKVGYSPLKKATGGSQNLLAVDEAMAEQIVMQKRAIRMNQTLKELYNSLQKSDKSEVTQIPVPTGDITAATLLTSSPENFVQESENGKYTAMFYDDGEIKSFTIPEEIYKAFEPSRLEEIINKNAFSKASAKVLKKVTDFRRNLLTTYSIGFAFNNPIKDIQEAVFNTKYSPARFAANYGRALFEMATGGKYYKDYLRQGGGANTYFEYDTGLKKPNKFVKGITTPIRIINTLNEVIERAPRLAEYISTMQKTGDVNQALYNSAELTTNFKRGGDTTKALNRYGVNFFNASVQGMDKLWRNIKGENGAKGYVQLVTRATIFGIAPAIISGIVYKDDDDYEDLPDYIKNGYWLFKTGEGKFARVPQGRVMSTLSTIAKDILEVGQGKKNVTEALKNALSNTIEQSAPNNPIENNIASPLFQVKNNKSWYGSDIVGTRLQKLPEAEQYDERTDEFSKFLGEQLNISPKKINYLIDQYSGGFGDVILPALTPYAENNIIEDKFTTDAVLKNKHVGEFYDLLEEMEKQKNSKKATEDDNLMYKYLYSQNSAMSDYYKQKREIESSDELTDKEKKEQVREVQKNINNIAEQAIEEYQNLNKKSNYATIGGQEYKKNTKGEWETITEKKQEKVDGLKLSDTQKDKYYTIQNKISNINKKYSDDNKNVAAKRQEITNTIKNTNLSDNAKVQLYKSSYSTDTKIDKAIDCGISADKYLTYASKTFTADKDKYGKSISGSKKTKVISYVNSLDLSAGQKAVLLKMEGYNDYNKQAIQYINGLNISASKKQSIYKDLGFKVNSNGTISW